MHQVLLGKSSFKLGNDKNDRALRTQTLARASCLSHAFDNQSGCNYRKSTLCTCLDSTPTNRDVLRKVLQQEPLCKETREQHDPHQKNPKALHQHPHLQFSQETSAQCRGKFSAQDGPTPCRHPTPQTPRILRQSGTSMKRSFSQVWRQVSSWIDVKNPSTTFMCAMCARNVF